jgi:hypothetical protein
MKIVGYIFSAILIFFGVLLAWGSFSQNSIFWLIGGIVMILIGLAVIFLTAKRTAPGSTTNVTYNVDLPGNVKVDSIKCKSCGGTLRAKDISMVNGAPMVTCPFCHTVYQFTEEPKW